MSESIKQIKGRIQDEKGMIRLYERSVAQYKESLAKLEARLAEMERGVSPRKLLPSKAKRKLLPAKERVTLAKTLLRSNGIVYFCDHRRKSGTWSLKPYACHLSPQLQKALTFLSDGGVVLQKEPKGGRPWAARFYKAVVKPGKLYRWHFRESA